MIWQTYSATRRVDTLMCLAYCQSRLYIDRISDYRHSVGYTSCRYTLDMDDKLPRVDCRPGDEGPQCLAIEGLGDRGQTLQIYVTRTYILTLTEPQPVNR